MALEICLPADKLKDLLKEWSGRKAGKKHDLLSLIGTLHHQSGSAEYTANGNYYCYKHRCWSSDERSWMKILLTDEVHQFIEYLDTINSVIYAVIYVCEKVKDCIYIIFNN